MWSFSLCMEDIYAILLAYFDFLQYFCSPKRVDIYKNINKE